METWRMGLFNLYLSTRRVALTACSAALYVVFSYLNVIPVVGAVGKWISAAVVVAPLLGMLLGPYLGVLAITVGGIVGAFSQLAGPFGPLSFIPHVAAAFCSGMLAIKKQRVCVVVYAVLLFSFMFFPAIGPFWLWPAVVWFDLIGLAVLASPLQTMSRDFMSEDSSPGRLAIGIATTCFTATLFSHVCGSIFFETVYSQVTFDVDFWRATWQSLTFLYPVERSLIVLAATSVGVPLMRALGIFRKLI